MSTVYLAINEKANEVRKILSAVKAQYDTFSTVLAKAKKKIDEAGKSLDDAQHRNDIIQKKLKGIEELETPEAEAVLGIDSVSADFDEYFWPERRQYVSEEIDIRSEAFEYAMLRLRLADGFSLDEYESRFGDRFLREKEDIARDYERMGLIYLKDGRISLSEKGFYLSNSIISSLL